MSNPIRTTNLSTLDYFNKYLEEHGATSGVYKSFCLTFTNLLNSGQWVNFKLSQTVTLGEGKHKRSSGGRMIRLVQQYEFKTTKENKDAITALAQDENSIVTARKIEGKDLHVNVVSKSAVATTVDSFKEFIRADLDSLTEQYAKQREEREKEDEKWLSSEDIENLFSAA